LLPAAPSASCAGIWTIYKDGIDMKKSAELAAVLATALVGTGFAGEGPTPKRIPHLDHVYLIMMENHGYGQIVNNPNAPFVNQLAKSANMATNYFAVGHPSLTNYLEVVGGSNFGVQSDNNPDWHNPVCSPNLATGVASTDNPPSPAICPISGTGTDAGTPAVDTTNESRARLGRTTSTGCSRSQRPRTQSAKPSPTNLSLPAKVGRATRKAFRWKVQTM
jgi:phosphatidylinositol-3-phosphatase